MIELFEKKKLKESPTKHETLQYKFRFVKVLSSETNRLSKFFETFYPWNSIFRFSSRFINAIVYTVVVLYYFVINFSYFIIVNLTYYLQFMPETLEQGYINIGEIMCNLSSKLCYDIFNNINITVPKLVLQYLPSKTIIITIFSVSIIVALFICLTQLFLLIRETRYYVIKLQKGTCSFVDTKKKQNSGSIGKIIQSI